ncbi:efflux RND transporter periplasmic adaptor subunit [Novosphingobium album (ex Hu et al. 2023)]|uniref:Efflux RND transporter periplasmic adaptor subunit n=1 Tax=Novosphingobium album (ex Hu et al. 2023) TaxID=2930093 RepID=A0ABT0B1N0_9SPHN|nr:efflux RND transporter periplasmic adaptor subunit [Novosphingobium album (ex Hu et al. 2023)]MCJ2178939.1 efflux RND transporter periplasmic adaptor subunit [Novosphingobium album (ex Hu et al. 2023)]
MNKPLLVGAAALLAVAGGAYYVLKPGDAPQEAAQTPTADPGALSAEQVKKLGIRTQAATAADAVPLGTVPGQVSLPPEAKVAVTTPFSGTITQVRVLQGEQVTRGQPLAIVKAAEPVQFSADLSRAQADLAVDRARAQRLDKLARDGIVAGARADEAMATLRRSEATVAENNRLLALAGAGRDGTVTLRAPISGRVASVSVETGGPVGGDMAPFVIENTAALTLDLQLPERLAGQVRPGMSVSVPLSGGSPVSGRIISVGASIDPATRSIAAKARLHSTDGLVPGRGVMAIISGVSGKEQSGVSVPSQAVTRMGEDDVVFVQERGRFVRREVTVVADAGGRAILTSGLKAGEQVAVSGVAELKSLLAEQ